MITAEEQRADWLRFRKVHNMVCSRRGYKLTPLTGTPDVVVFEYMNGKGRIVFDANQFENLPKRKQQKLLKLMNRIK